MFATIAADYPREPRAGEPDVLGEIDRRLADGEISRDEHLEAARGFIKVILQEQEVAGLGILSDGAVVDEDRLEQLVEGLGGTSLDRPVTLPDGAGARVPHFKRAPAWTESITVAGWQWADESTDLLVKQALVGPYTLARLALPGPVARGTLALGLAEALNAELLALAQAGCPLIQVDEGALATIGDDDAEWQLYAETQRRLTAGLDDHHLSLGIYRGAVHAAGYRSILDGPYRSFLFDAYGGPDAWRFAFAVPPELGLVVGALDASTEIRDETEVMVWAMAWSAHGDRPTDRIGIASNGSLRAIGRHPTRRKSELMGEAVRIASMGPLQEVAEALDPTPLESRMDPLRALAASVEAAREPR